MRQSASNKLGHINADQLAGAPDHEIRSEMVSKRLRTEYKRKLMKKIIAAATVAALSLAASSALAGTLVNPSVTLSNTGLSQPTTITATYTTVADVPSGEFMLRAMLPAGFTKITADQISDCTGVTLKVNNIVQTAGSAPTCSLFTGGTLLIWTNALVPGGSSVEIHLASSLYATPSTAGVKSFTMFRTAEPNGTAIDDAVPMPSVTVGAPAPVPTLTEWAMILLTVALGGFAALTINKRRRTV